MSYIGKDTQITIRGKAYTLSRFDRRLAQDFLKWAKTILPNPLANVAEAINDLPPAIAEKVAMRAYEESKELLDISSPAVQGLLASLEGLGKLVCLLFQRKHPELTDEEAWELFEQAEEEHGREYLQGVLAECTGEMPPDPVAAEQAMYEAKGWIEPEKKSGNPPTGLKSTEP